MTEEYKQFVRAKISTKKFQQILCAFALDSTATQIAVLTNLNRNTVNQYLHLLAKRLPASVNESRPSPVSLNWTNLTLKPSFPKANADGARRA